MDELPGAEIDRPSAAIYQFPVANKISAATDETGATPLSAEEVSGEAKEPRAFLQAARRNLTEDEAASPAGRRWLIYDIERLDRECTSYRKDIQDLRGRHDTLMEQNTNLKVEVGALKGAARVSLRNEILSYLCFSAGSAGLSVLPGYLSAPATAQLATIGLVVAGLLFFGGVALRVWK